MLVNTISDSRIKSEYSTAVNHTRDIKQIENLIFDRPNEIIYVEDLRQVTGYNKRTLEYIFKNYYGISPHAYLKKIRLNNVQSDLMKSDVQEVRIVDIANKWGFWHMGQFAADYRKLFNELPSQTMSKATY